MAMLAPCGNCGGLVVRDGADAYDRKPDEVCLMCGRRRLGVVPLEVAFEDRHRMRQPRHFDRKKGGQE